MERITACPRLGENCAFPLPLHTPLFGRAADRQGVHKSERDTIIIREGCALCAHQAQKQSIVLIFQPRTTLGIIGRGCLLEWRIAINASQVEEVFPVA